MRRNSIDEQKIFFQIDMTLTFSDVFVRGQLDRFFLSLYTRLLRYEKILIVQISNDFSNTMLFLNEYFFWR